MTLEPLVTVIVPVFNAGPYLRAAVQSVLCQTHKNLQVVVIDDGSTDGCVDTIQDLLQDPRASLICQENAGKPAAMNRAIAMASGEFYVVNDADDISRPDRVAKQASFLSQNLDVAGVFCGFDLILDGRHCAPLAHPKTREQCATDVAEFRMPGHDPTAMYRLSMVRGIQFAAELRLGEGLDYCLRVGEKWPLCVLGETLYSYRIHFESLTRSDPRRRVELTRVALRRACERRGIAFEERFPQMPMGRWRNSDRDNHIATTFIDSVCDQKERGRVWDALCDGLLCASLHPLDVSYYKALLYALSPLAGMRWVRSRRAQHRNRVHCVPSESVKL